MKSYHTCDYKHYSWYEPDETLKECIKKNKTIKKIRRDLMKKRLQKHKDKIQGKKSRY